MKGILDRRHWYVEIPCQEILYEEIGVVEEVLYPGVCPNFADRDVFQFWLRWVTFWLVLVAKEEELLDGSPVTDAFEIFNTFLTCFPLPCCLEEPIKLFRLGILVTLHYRFKEVLTDGFGHHGGTKQNFVIHHMLVVEHTSLESQALLGFDQFLLFLVQQVFVFLHLVDVIVAYHEVIMRTKQLAIAH